MSTENASSTDIQKEMAKTMAGASLPFSEKRQSAFIGHLFDVDTRLFKHVYGVTDAKWFGDPTHQKIWKHLVKFYETYKRLPFKTSEFLDWSYLKVEDEKTLSSLKLKVDRSISDRADVGIDILRDEIEEWMQAKILQDAIERGVGLYNKGDFKLAKDLLSDSIKKYNSASMALEDTTPADILGSIGIDLGDGGVVPFGIHTMDNFLFPNNPRGSLRKGDQTILMAPTNIGKTTTMTTVAVHNARAGNRTLFMAHEGHASDLRLKFLRAFFALSDVPSLRAIRYFATYDDVELQKISLGLRNVAAMDTVTLLKTLEKVRGKTQGEILEKVTEHVFDYIHFIPYIKPGVEIEELYPVIERAQDNCKQKTGGAGFDLFVCDYPGILSTRKGSQGNYQMRQIKQEVYESYALLAGQHKWHSLVAIQVNREGSKVNSGIGRNGVQSQHAERYLGNEDVSEVWGALMSASTVITINRSPQEQQMDRVTYVVTKSRSSQIHFAVQCYSKFGQSLSHADMLGSISRFATSPNSAVVDSLMREGQNIAMTQNDETAAAVVAQRIADQVAPDSELEEFKAPK